MICTEELDKVQFGAGETTGVTLQLRLMVPLKEPEGATVSVNFALSPAVMVCDVGDPLAGPRLKLGAAVATPDKDTVWGPPGASSETVIVPARVPVVDGLKITEIWQLLPAASEALQVLVSTKP